MGGKLLIALLAATVGSAALIFWFSHRGPLQSSDGLPPPPPPVRIVTPKPPAPSPVEAPPPAPAPPDVAQVEPPANPAPPESEQNEGLIHEVSERTVATSNGDVHIRTGDGAYYDLQLVGEFIALKSSSDELEVQARQAPWQGTSRSVSTNVAVAMNVAGDRVGFYAGPNGGLHVDGKPTPIPGEDERIELPHGGRVAHVGSRFQVVWPDQTEVRVTMWGDYIDFQVDLARSREGKVAGLFGGFRGNAATDLVSRDGVQLKWPDLTANAPGGQDKRKTLYGLFGASWRIRQEESLFEYGPGESTRTWTDLDFPYAVISLRSLDGAVREKAEQTCRQAGAADAHFLANCIVDVAATGDPQFAQSAVQGQTDVKLQGGLHCQGMPLQGSRCTYYEPSLPGARVGALLQFSLETMDEGGKQIEPFDCTRVDTMRRASCTIVTKGKVFGGSNVVTRYELESGKAYEEKATMEKE